MGHSPPGQHAAPSRESFHLGIARAAYLGESLDLDEYERSVAHVLAGGSLNQAGRIGGPPAPRDPSLLEMR
jgi:hypothetical protein